MHANPPDLAASATLIHARDLTPEQRLDELTALLATGVCRVLALRAAPPLAAECPTPAITHESDRNCLDVPAETSLHVPRELTPRESAEGVCL